MKLALHAFAHSCVAGLGAVLAWGSVLAMADYISTPQHPVMVLERVVIVGKAQRPSAEQGAPVVTARLPRVLIEGRSSGWSQPASLLALDCGRSLRPQQEAVAQC